MPEDTLQQLHSPKLCPQSRCSGDKLHLHMVRRACVPCSQPLSTTALPSEPAVAASSRCFLCYLANVNNQPQVKRCLRRPLAPSAEHGAGPLPRGRHGLPPNCRARSRICGATAAPQCGRVPSERTWALSRYGAERLRRPFAAGGWRGGAAAVQRDAEGLLVRGKRVAAYAAFSRSLFEAT